MADIFISYSQKDRAWVELLVDALTAEGWEVWWDLNIRSGESFDEAIERKLEQVRCVVTVWSKHAVKSKWVRAEAAWAADRNKVVPIQIEEDLDLPLKFYLIQTQDLTGWKGSRNAPAFRKVVEDIRTVGAPPSAQLAGAHAPSAPKTESDLAAPSAGEKPPLTITITLRGVVVGVIALGVAALVGGVFYFDEAGNSTAPEMITIPALSSDPSASEPTAIDAETPEGVAPFSTFRDTLKDGSKEPEMVVIPAGTFQMGCVSGKGCQDGEFPVHAVTFDKPFAVGKHEVTFDEYDRFAEVTGAKKPYDAGWGRGRRPVIHVSWNDAAAYAIWLSEQTGERYRLPGEAEWEYAARAGTQTPWSFDDTKRDLATYAWYAGNSSGTSYPVEKKEPNPWGLYDVHGNVWEWVRDCWNYYSDVSVPGVGSAREGEDRSSCSQRVIRGGSSGDWPKQLRSSARQGSVIEYRLASLGFRLARDL